MTLWFAPMLTFANMTPILAIIFWVALALVAYVYVGYAGVVGGLAGLFGKRQSLQDPDEWPAVTLLVAAYNERDIIDQKVANHRSLDYPTGKLQFVFVTDGSDDGTPAALATYTDMRVLHTPERGGKTAAIMRALPHIDTPITVLTDANTMLNPGAIKALVRHFKDDSVGVVAGEKRVRSREQEAAAGAGESLYWRFESWLKTKESELGSTMGAAGELYALRTPLHPKLEHDTILDDLVTSLRIMVGGYRVKYEPGAYALETPSFSIADEMRRKVRIAAGGYQAIGRLPAMLNVFRRPLRSWMYLSHRVMRWAIGPLLLPLILALNITLAIVQPQPYGWLLAAQLGLYTLALIGWLLERRQLRFKLLFVPFYFMFMNVAAIRGAWRHLRKQQSQAWERARRAE